MTIKLALFDMGGTLVEYPMKLEDMARAFVNYRHEVGLSRKVMIDWADYFAEDRGCGMANLKEATFASSLKRALVKNNISMSEALITRILLFLYGKFCANPATIIPGARELLCCAKMNQLKVGLISNTPWPGTFPDGDLRRFGLANFFDLKIWSSEEGVRKPHKILFLKALELMDFFAEEAVYIGDNFSRDVVGPNSIGMKAIWFSSNAPPTAFNGWQIKNLAEAKSVLTTITG